MKKDRLDELHNAIIWALLQTNDENIAVRLRDHLDFIYAVFPEQKENAIEKKLW